MSAQLPSGFETGRPAGRLPAAAPAEAGALLVQVEDRMRDLVAYHPGSAAQEAALSHLQAGGGRFRARLAIDAGLALRLEPRRILAIAAAVELVHNASLIHDDLQDRDPQRRQAAAVWAEFGDAVAVCAGDLMLSAAYAALADTGAAAPRLISRLHRRVSALIHGQDADLASGRDVSDLEAYEAIATGKSGALLVLPLEFALELAEATGALAVAAACGRSFALGYQMFDDLRDVEGDRAKAALNAVLVLEARGLSAPELEVARLAARHFRHAAALSARLPSDCGRLLAATAQRLSAQLPHKDLS